MEANTNVPSGQGMHLRRLRDLPDFEVASNNPDVRGWSVRGSDGKKFGEVYELIVEEEALKVRYLAIELDSSLNINERDRHILLPIGVAALDEESDNVFVPSLTSESVLNYPPFVEIQITREYEQAMLKSLNLPLPSHADAGFYHHTSYDDEQFYRRGRFVK
jgi:photosynthetic reaction center H subunit